LWRSAAARHRREAASGREALELLHAVAADLVLTDIHMPDMDGSSSRGTC